MYDELLSMCGIPRLLKELQKRQLDHMLSQRHRLLGNLTALASKLDVTVRAVQNMQEPLEHASCFSMCRQLIASTPVVKLMKGRTGSAFH